VNTSNCPPSRSHLAGLVPFVLLFQVASRMPRATLWLMTITVSYAFLHAEALSAPLFEDFDGLTCTN
jgi:hypothetical protein